MINKNLIPVSITGIGKCVPETIITNDDISKIVDTNDEWISTRTGIKQRRVVSGDETAVSLAVKAAKDAMGYAGISAEEIDVIITATSMPDALYPSTSCEIHKAIGATNAAAFDVVAACSGLIYALNIARNFIMTGTYETALIVGVDLHSRFIDWTDRSTCVLFGDASGAMVVQKSKDEINDILAIDMHADGSKADELRIPLSGNNCPLVQPNTPKKQIVNMNGREIYKFAVRVVPDSILKSLEIAGMSIDDVDYLIPHQANMRIVSAITERLNLNPDQVIVNLDKYGNTSTASIPLALSEALEENNIKMPSTMIICGFGAGLTWGTALVRWRAQDQRSV
jgi:3-oxoacyl-[acyl-carrier-protein] synthase III